MNLECNISNKGELNLKEQNKKEVEFNELVKIYDDLIDMKKIKEQIENSKSSDRIELISFKRKKKITKINEYSIPHTDILKKTPKVKLLAEEFIKKGYKVNVDIMLKGRSFSFFSYYVGHMDIW